MAQDQAIIGFTEFTTCLQNAHRQADSDHFQRLQAVGNAYVEFAVTDPEMFKLMFSSPLLEFCNERLYDISQRSYGELSRVVRPLCGHLENEQQIQQAEKLVWSVVHGYAHLLIKQQAAGTEQLEKELPPLFILRKLLTPAPVSD